MASYVYIQNYSRLGSIGLSNYTFRQIAENATRNIEGVLLKDEAQEGATWELSKPIDVIIRDNTRVDITVSINLIGKLNVHQTCVKIQESVAEKLLLMAELIPFKINVKVVSIKSNASKKTAKK